MAGWDGTQSHLLARVHLDGLRAHLALDVAAPVELAVAALAHRHLLRVVAAAAAHEVAAVHAVRGAVAVPALGACNETEHKVVKIPSQYCLNFLEKDMAGDGMVSCRIYYAF